MTDSMEADMREVEADMREVEMQPTLPLPTAPDVDSMDSASATTVPWLHALGEDTGGQNSGGEPPSNRPTTRFRPEGEDDASDPSPASHRRRRMHAAFFDRRGPN